MLRQGFKGKNVLSSFRGENGSKCSIPLKSGGSWLNFGNFYSLFDVCYLIVFLSFIWLHAHTYMDTHIHQTEVLHTSALWMNLICLEFS